MSNAASDISDREREEAVSLAAFNREKSARFWEGEGEPVTNQLPERGEKKRKKVHYWFPVKSHHHHYHHRLVGEQRKPFSLFDGGGGGGGLLPGRI